jgi:hypothetical protein
MRPPILNFTRTSTAGASGANENEVAQFRDPHGCIGEYKTALGLNLASISHSTRDPERTLELIKHSMRLLDQRMKELRSAIARCFRLTANIRFLQVWAVRKALPTGAEPPQINTGRSITDLDSRQFF